MPTTKMKLRELPDGTLLSLVALALNSLASLLGASGISKGGTAIVFFLVLLFCFYFLPSYLLGKYLLLYGTNKWKPCCRCPQKPSGLNVDKTLEYYSEEICRKQVAYDVFNCLMILFYLVGDNLKQMVCNPECGSCPMIAQFFTGLSLILNLTLTLLRDAGPGKGSLPSAFPVIGKRGSSYNKMLQIAAKALIIDQALTAILEHINKNTTDPECGKIVDNNKVLQIAFISAYFGIIVLIALVVLVFLCWGEKKTFFGCSWNVGTCCEVSCQWCIALCTVLFIAVFMVADIDWFWDLWKDSPQYMTALKIARLTLLVISFMYSFFLIAFYFFVIGLPGLGVVLEKKQFFLAEHGVHGVLSASESMEQGEDNIWTKTDDDKKKSASTKKMKDTVGDGNVESQSADTYRDKCVLKKSVEVEDDFGEATISFTFKEEIPCLQGFCAFCGCQRILKWAYPKEGKKSHWIMKGDFGEVEKFQMMESSICSTAGSANP